MTNEEIKELERSIDQMMTIAKGFGLDFYDMRFEICPADIIYTFGAYGMPTRFSHWSFGKSFHRMKMSYDFGLSRIYELVINSDPCYAFLLDGNMLIQNKMVSAHVLAHCDFFKNNARFRNTKRSMVDSMSSAAERIREYEFQYGKLKVEQFLDDCLAISEHIDPALIRNPREELESRMSRKGALTIQKPESWSNPDGSGQSRSRTPYDDLWSLDERNASPAPQAEVNRPVKMPKNPSKDLLFYLMQHSHILEEWQCDVLSIIREEMLYFWPQIETKIMNEGWATYWHLRIMREMEMTSDDAIEFAKLHSGVVVPSRSSINPYHIGLKMWEDLEKRVGMDEMFEIREFDSDISFLRNYLTKELCEDMDLFVFQKKGNEWKVTDIAWETVRDQLCASRVNGGFPVIVVEDGDYLSSGELYLKHLFEGVELDVKYLEKTIPHVYNLWGKTVHLQTVLENRPVLFTYDGKKNHRKFM